MAVVKKNVITEGLSGKLGDSIVFRRVGGRTIVATKPEVSSKPPSEAAERQMDRFREAVIYAKYAVVDDTLGPEYEAEKVRRKKNSSYVVAVADFLKVPEIKEVDLSGYSGQPGDKITIKAYDDFMVKEVRVTIQNPDGSLVESGLAESQPNGDWQFTATAVNEDLSGDKITIEVTDLPGNMTSQQEVL